MWVALNSILLLQTALKFMFFARTNQTFGLLVTLVLQTLRDFVAFLIFYLSWVCMISLLFLVSGVQAPDLEDYPDMPKYAAYWIQVFRNSVGDLGKPRYGLWSSKMETDAGYARGLIAYGWILWHFNIIFMLIVLLNFLIAIISTSYESVMTKQLETEYRSKCRFNVESTLLLENFFRLIGQDIGGAGVFYLGAIDDQTHSTSEEIGFVRPI